MKPAVLPQIATLARIGQVPAVLLAPLFGWQRRAFFAADPADAFRPDTELRPAG